MNNTFLVRLSISQWSARKMDKGATKDAKASAGAAEKANVKVYKTVLAAQELETIKTIANAARIDHQKRTVPWSYEGAGAITAEGYPAYKAAMAGHEKEFTAAVARFHAVYDHERNEARSYLGNMFNAADYPSSADVAARFAFAVNAEPMPQAENFRPIGLAPALVEEIRLDIIENNAAALENANATGWSRVLEATEKLKLRLQEYNAGTVTKFFDSWLDNVTELAAMIPSINVANDSDLTRIGQKLVALTAYNNADLKADERLRADCVKQVGSILAQIGECYKAAA